MERLWTLKEETYLIERKIIGRSWSEIGKNLHRTADAVRGRYYIILKRKRKL